MTVLNREDIAGLRKITEGQREWLEILAATEYGMIPRIGIEVGSGASIASIVKRGLAEWSSGRSFLRLTDLGRRTLQSKDKP